MPSKQYMIVTAERDDLLEKEVMKQIDEGWKPTGGVSFCCSDEVSIWAQALTKKSNITTKSV
jgi:hypothetical protein